MNSLDDQSLREELAEILEPTYFIVRDEDGNRFNTVALEQILSAIAERLPKPQKAVNLEAIQYVTGYNACVATIREAFGLASAGDGGSHDNVTQEGEHSA